MDLVTFAQTLQFILAPVVMVTACAVLLNGILSRYSEINLRLRTMAHERYELLRELSPARNDMSQSELISARLHEIDAQVPMLLQRHRIMRDALISLYGAVLAFILAMLVIAAAAIGKLSAFTLGALGVFLLGSSLVLLSMLLTVIEVRISHRALDYEVRHVLDLRE
jgi:hypothetical protein